LSDVIRIEGLRLWAHVGVLERERLLGQWFELDITLRHDLSAAGRTDDLGRSLDYAEAIRALQVQARELRCLTIEHYAERVMDRLEDLYGPVPLQVVVGKCRAPVPGFDGRVSVERRRHQAPAV
jgi:dihydroneopterin aldolase